jgi:hypothetical protein
MSESSLCIVCVVELITDEAVVLVSVGSLDVGVGVARMRFCSVSLLPRWLFSVQMELRL